MRDLLVFAAVFGALPFVFKRPAWGILLYVWISLMNPHRLAYGPAYDFPFAALVAAVTALALLLAPGARRLPLNWITGTLVALACWMSVTSLTALQSDLAWTEWVRVMKTLFMVLLAVYVLEEERDTRLLAWVLGLSLAFYGVKGGLFTILTGGGNRVIGPEGSYIEDNNSLALALVMAAPLVWYLHMQARRPLVRASLLGITLLTVVAAAGSYSRGALLAGAAMLVFLWLKSRQKLKTGLAVLLLVPLIYVVMPEQWFARMQTIDSYQQDSSAMGRINAWHFALNVAARHPLGGGFNVFTRDMFYQYAPDPLNYHVAHSIYFQVLGEHGYVGLALFLLLLVSAWRAGTRIERACRALPELAWAADLAAMIQVSLVGFAVGGAFLSLAYYDYTYFLIGTLVLIEKNLAARRLAPRSAPAPTTTTSMSTPQMSGRHAP